MSIVEPTIALVFSPETWVEQLHRHLADHGGARIRQIVVEPSTVGDESFDVLVVSHRWPALTPGLVRNVHAAGARVLGIADREEPAAREHLVRMGVDGIVPADVALPSIVEAIRAVAPVQDERAQLAGMRDRADVGARVGSQIVTVGGPHGSGKTELAVAVAVALVDRRESVLLLDADEHHAAIAIRLGLPPHASLRTAIAMMQTGGDVAQAPLPRGRIDVVPGGMPTTGRAPVDPSDALALLAELGHRYDHVVIDTSGVADSALGRALLSAANAVLGIGAASPVGLSRLVSWASLAAPSLAARLSLVVNFAPHDRFRRGEVVDELRLAVGAPVGALLPFDQRVVRAAWDARPVDRGPFADQVQALVDAAMPRGERRVGRGDGARRRSRSAAA
jgi:MinD-like ATPase involved in chromosome partitioning or flagellar assembly